jgi:Polysulphide reductase, NrfD
MNTPNETTISQPLPMPLGLLAVLGVMVAVGAVGLVMGVSDHAQRAWQAYLVNYLFFLGIGSGGVLFTCVVNLARGRWGRPVKRVAEGLGMFLPISLLLFLAMIPGLPEILPWVKTPYGPTWWNSLPLLIGRELLVLGLLNIFGMWILYLSLRTDLGQTNEAGGKYDGLLHRFLTRNWRGGAIESASARKKLYILSTLYALTYALGLSVVAMDLIMSLKENWISTLIGGYYFAGSFYITLAALLLAAIWARKRFALEHAITPGHLADIAKLTMAFGIVTGDFFYCQLMMIWYGNLPHETSFLIDRMVNTPWRAVGILVMLGCFALPLLAFLSRRIKEMAAPMVVFGVFVLSAMWWERYLSLGPSITGKQQVYFGLPEILVTLGFLGLLVLVFTYFMHRVPPLIADDPVLDHLEETS